MSLFAGKCHCPRHFLFSRFTIMQFKPEDFLLMAYLRTCLGYSSRWASLHGKKEKNFKIVDLPSNPCGIIRV